MIDPNVNTRNYANGSSVHIGQPDGSSVEIDAAAVGANPERAAQGTAFPERGTDVSIQTTRFGPARGQDEYGQDIRYGTRRSVGVDGNEVVIRSAPMQQPYDYGSSVYYGHNGLREGAHELRIASPEVAGVVNQAIRAALRGGLTASEAQQLEGLRETVARLGADDGRYSAQDIARITDQATRGATRDR